MVLIKLPLEVDLIVDPRPLTKKEELAISVFIKADKIKRALKQKRAKTKQAASKKKQPA